MGFRFYRRIRILPGVSLNLGKKGASVSVGPRGAKMTFGSRGARMSVGLPGTGMRYEKTFAKGPKMARTPNGTGSSWCVLILCALVGLASLGKNISDPNGLWILFACVSFAVVGILLIAKAMSFGNGESSLLYSKRHAPSGGANGDMAYACRSLYSFLKMVDRSPRCGKELSETPGLEGVGSDGNHFTLSQKLAFIVFCDLRDVFARLGHNVQCLHNREGVGYAMMISLLISKEIDLEWFDDPVRAEKLIGIIEDLSKKDVGHITIQGHEDELRFALIFGKIHHEQDWVNRYASLLYKWASLVAKANGSISSQEGEILKSIMELQSGGAPSGNVRITGAEKAGPELMDSDLLGTNQGEAHSSRDDRGLADDGFGALNGLVGLVPVKKEVCQLANFIKIQRKRERAGMRTAPVSYHCVFTGNPGTGKTTVARILAEIYRDLGVVKKGHLVETDRSGLIGEYVGQTAVKTNKIIDAALDGVLFIDEAYSLVQGGEKDYGREAIATLLKRMEDDRKRLVVILAGYTAEMKTFIDSNPGLQSRFNRYIEFPDYNADELAKIFLLRMEECQYSCNAAVRASLRDIMQRAVEMKDKNFGNGRFVRNLFERAIQRQASRLSAVSPLTQEMLSELTLDDIGRDYEN